MKRLMTSGLVLVSALTLTACADGNGEKAISKNKATDIALKDAKLSKKEVSDFKITSDDKDYDYTVNA